MNDWPRAWGEPTASAQFKTAPEHFQVEEISSVKPSGQGDYLYLKIIKCDIDTAAVASELAKFFKVKPFAVSYAGRKDKYAVTTQWFSVHLTDQSILGVEQPIHAKFVVEEQARHNTKLPIGELSGNRFTILLTDVVGDKDQIAAQLETIKSKGFPNYFGEQRFGSKGQNLIRGQRMLAGELRVKDKNQRSMYLSACRSFLFNELLGDRLQQNNWQTLVAGDLCVQEFPDHFPDWPMSDLLAESPMGHIPGDGAIPVDGVAGDMMTAVLNKHQSLFQGIRNSRVAWHQRPYLMQANDLSYGWIDEQLQLTFSLPKGTFATSLLRELVVSA